MIKFISNDNIEVKISAEHLTKYPQSLLTQIALHSESRDYLKDNDAFKVEIDSKTLNHIKFFYEKGFWNFNPFRYEFSNELYIPHVSDLFEIVCEYLGLPDDEFSDNCPGDNKEEDEETDFDDYQDYDTNLGRDEEEYKQYCLDKKQYNKEMNADQSAFDW